MHFRIITRFIAILSFFLGLSMAAPLLVSLIYKDTSTPALFFSMCITTFISIILFISTKRIH